MTSPAQAPPRFRYFDLVMAGFVTVLLCSNLIGPGKSCAVNLHANIAPRWTEAGLAWGPQLIFSVGSIFFPLSYIFGDVLTEVYGYARARRVIWAGFVAMLFASIMAQVVIHLPPDSGEPFNERMQPSLETLFGSTWRIVIASALAFWVGDFANSYVLAKLKVLTRGRWLWTRTIGSTIIGQGLDSLIFFPVAFAGIWTNDTLARIVVFNWIFKVMVEVVLTPATYAAVGFLKRAEGVDHYDVDTNFTPFSLKY